MSLFRRSALLAVLLGATVFSSVPANAQYPFPKGSTLAVTGDVKACGIVVLSGGGYKPFSSVTVKMNGEVVGTTTANADGNFFFEATVPCDQGGKKVTFTATGVNPDGTVRIMTFEGNVLARTGSNSLTFLYVGLAAVVAGGVLFALGKRRAIVRA